jgi:hypothetical protein
MSGWDRDAIERSNPLSSSSTGTGPGSSVSSPSRVGWSRVEAVIATRKPADYDTAVTDLQALAERDGHNDTVATRITALRQPHARNPNLIQRLDRAGI